MVDRPNDFLADHLTGVCIRSNIQVQNAIQEQAYLTYQETVLNALEEVEDSAVAYSNEQVHRRRSLSDAVEADKVAVNLATQRYNAGLTDFLSVLVTEQKSVRGRKMNWCSARRTVSANLVKALYKALGGGWEPIEREEMKAGPTTKGSRPQMSSIVLSR